MQCLVKGTVEFDISLVEHDDAVGNAPNAVEIVRDDDERHAKLFFEPDHERIEVGGRHRIEPRRWLIAQYELGLQYHRARKSGALEHAATQLPRQQMYRMRQLDLRQLVIHEFFDHVVGQLRMRHERYLEVIEHCQ